MVKSSSIRACVMAQWFESCLLCFWSSSLLMCLRRHGKWPEHLTSTWLRWSLRLQLLAWLFPSHGYHLKNDPVDGRALSLSVTVFQNPKEEITWLFLCAWDSSAGGGYRVFLHGSFTMSKVSQKSEVDINIRELAWSLASWFGVLPRQRKCLHPETSNNRK